MLFANSSRWRRSRAAYQPIRDAVSEVTMETENERQQQHAGGGAVQRSPTSNSSSSINMPQHQQQHRPNKGSVADFFFGFMYEEDVDDWLIEYDAADDELYSSKSAATTTTTSTESSSSNYSFWKNPLHVALCLSLILQTAATATAATLVASSIGNDASMLRMLKQQQLDNNNNAAATTTALVWTDLAAQFAQRAAASAVRGTALGKFIHGPVADVCGARQTSVVYALAMSFALLALGLSHSPNTAVTAVFAIEFFFAVQRPCTVVILATHHRRRHTAVTDTTTTTNSTTTTNTTGLYEHGIFVTSLAGKLGTLIGIPLSSGLLRWGVHWRVLACLAAWLAAVASSVTYFFVRDSREARDQPQNPIDPALLQPLMYGRKPTLLAVLQQRWRWVNAVWQTNIRPSVRHIVRSPTFWLVAIAHTGASTIRTSERVLGTYFYATNSNSSSNGLSHERAASLAVFHSVGTVAGLLVAGQAFTTSRGPKHHSHHHHNPRARKWFISRLYLLSITACYILALTAVPSVRRGLTTTAGLPDSLFIAIQVVAVMAAGFGIAVQFYHIPSLVGATTFGCDKGLYIAYTDGVAYALASCVWRFVLNDAGHHHSWAYGWAAVALLLVLTAILMVEFMEHYFCRPAVIRRNRYEKNGGRSGSGGGGTYETIIFA